MTSAPSSTPPTTSPRACGRADRAPSGRVAGCGDGTSGEVMGADGTIDTPGRRDHPSDVQPAAFSRARRSGVARVGRRRLFDDTHVLLAIAITLAATVIEIVAVEPGIAATARTAAIGGLYVGLQVILGVWSTPLSRPTPRLLLAVAFVSGLGLTVGEIAARPDDVPVPADRRRGGGIRSARGADRRVSARSSPTPLRSWSSRPRSRPSSSAARRSSSRWSSWPSGPGGRSAPLRRRSCGPGTPGRESVAAPAR